MSTTAITMTCKPFACYSRAKHSLLINDDDGTVLVYDKVAGYYTKCHSLSERSKVSARRKARAERRAIAEEWGCGAD